ncbi:transposase [Neopusillimonas aromaticivorans]|uniref:transposase n=1 Tax=Neopusillimonas aromaticivorans TaxID=2979868 RepID=UPI002591489E|nr:transposase [Neopusillimonas aromaticivorans]WJJ94250.1 transposase [Neopusillimonas aromaticivorans]
MFACPATDDFFRSRIDQMIDLRHPLAVLSSRMPWQELEARVAHLFVRKAHTGVAMPDLDLFGEKPQRQSSRSNAGRPRVPLRIMISLLYLKHAFNESDEGVVERWGETPTWQFFAGQAYFEHHRPCDATTLVKFRKLLGEEGVEELLAQTINVAVELKLIKPQKLSRQAGRYAHARQFKRMRRAIKRQRTIVGRLSREMDRKANVLGQAVRAALDQVLNKANRIAAQSAQRKSVKGQRKLYAWHAPEVDCISKGKTRRPYEFGVKVGIASTFKGNLIVGARAFHRNPYDGHTLNEQLEQATILMQDCAPAPDTVFVDLGYRGVDADNPQVRIVHRGKPKRLTALERKQLKRRQAIEPIIGHLKANHRMDRCHLKGEEGDKLHAVLCAAGYNLKWLLRMIAKKGYPSCRSFLRLKKAPP